MLDRNDPAVRKFLDACAETAQFFADKDKQDAMDENDIHRAATVNHGEVTKFKTLASDTYLDAGDELRRLRAENAELRKVNAHLGDRISNWRADAKLGANLRELLAASLSFEVHATDGVAVKHYKSPSDEEMGHTECPTLDEAVAKAAEGNE